MKKKDGVKPTKQHSMKCPKLYGKKCTCDGYHTFDELYEHRIALFIALCHQLEAAADELGKAHIAWKSKLHHDGTMFDGWFIAGIGVMEGKQISYHLPLDKWDLLYVDEREVAPLWDGHTPEDVIERVLSL